MNWFARCHRPIVVRNPRCRNHPKAQHPHAARQGTAAATRTSRRSPVAAVMAGGMRRDRTDGGGRVPSAGSYPPVAAHAGAFRAGCDGTDITKGDKGYREAVERRGVRRGVRTSRADVDPVPRAVARPTTRRRRAGCPGCHRSSRWGDTASGWRLDGIGDRVPQSVAGLKCLHRAVERANVQVDPHGAVPFGGADHYGGPIASIRPGSRTRRCHGRGGDEAADGAAPACTSCSDQGAEISTSTGHRMRPLAIV